MASAHLDCINGAAGDMLLAAILDAGAATAPVEEALAGCGVAVRLRTEVVFRAGLRGLRVSFDPGSGEVARQRDLQTCLAAVDGSDLPLRARARAAGALRALGVAEARLHGVAVDSVHLHELGAFDTMVDIVGVAAALEQLDVDVISCGPLPAGSGTVTTEHGELPLPAPAALDILAAAGFSLMGGVDGVEQVTPTGAAILAAMARPGPPGLRLRSVGHGAGARDDPRRPNLVRCWLGEPLPGALGEDAPATPEAFDDPAVELR
ncbi:MAG TPA: LarC family nickel insertion protein, partial [Candidatus Dormibacteraeota bacterium]